MSPLGDTGGRTQDISALFLTTARDYNYLKNDTLQSRLMPTVASQTLPPVLGEKSTPG